MSQTGKSGSNIFLSKYKKKLSSLKSTYAYVTRVVPYMGCYIERVHPSPSCSMHRAAEKKSNDSPV